MQLEASSWNPGSQIHAVPALLAAPGVPEFNGHERHFYRTFTGKLATHACAAVGLTTTLFRFMFISLPSFSYCLKNCLENCLKNCSD
jgi:hypothetical protein